MPHSSQAWTVLRDWRQAKGTQINGRQAATIGSATIGSATIGSATIGSATIGSATIGSATIGSANRILHTKHAAHADVRRYTGRTLANDL
jgi:hypothetical protein